MDMYGIFTVGVISVPRASWVFKASVDESGPRRAGSRGLTDEAGQIRSKCRKLRAICNCIIHCLGYPGFYIVDLDSYFLIWTSTIWIHRRFFS